MKNASSGNEHNKKKRCKCQQTRTKKSLKRKNNRQKRSISTEEHYGRVEKIVF